MDFQKGWDFVFKDEDWWKKCLVAAGLYITIIGSFAVHGWMLEIIRIASSDDEDVKLPEWDNFGKYFVDGLKLLGITFIWSLPVILLVFVLWAVVFFGAIAIPEEQSFFLPMMIFPFQMIVMLVSFPISILGVVASTLLANGHSYDQVLNPLNSWKYFKADFGNYIIAMTLYFVGNYFASMIGMMLCFIGIAFTSAIAVSLFGHFLGQAYKGAQAKLEASEV